MYLSQNIAERIKLIAKQKNISIKDMLFACELSKNAISSMLSGGSNPKSENLAKIADYLDCSVDYLLGRTDTPTAPMENSELDTLYNQLDNEDKIELRGIIKGMLHADKYK